MSIPFVHLRLHTEYSLVDSLLHIKPLINRVVELGMPAVALTDEMNLFAAIKFYKAATSAGVKPIFGADCWVWDEAAQERFRVCFLCLNNDGFLQLTELLSTGYLKANRMDGIPVLTWEMLEAQDMSGLLVLTGYHDGALVYHVEHDHAELAHQVLSKWIDRVGANQVCVEVQRCGRPHEEAVNSQLMALANKAGVPVVATHDVRFMQRDDFQAHEVRVAIRDGFTLQDPHRPKRYTEQQYLVSPEEMAARFSDCPQVLHNTVMIAQRCNVTFELGKACLPNFPIPETDTIDSYFRRVSHEGLSERLQQLFGQAVTPEKEQEYRQRLDVELDVILKMGFPGYFLIVADFIQWAKQNGVPVGPGRGSGAGSLVAYALKITDIDPLPYDLLFERFLNPERVSMPDFDVDFCMDGRDRVIDYVAERYGRYSVSQIITFGSMAAKAVVRDVGRVMGQPYGFVDSIAKLIPMDLGMTLTKALEDEPKLKERYEEEEEVRAILDMALTLEGTVRNVGKHAGGVVIAPSKLTDFTPIYCEAGTQQLVSQYDKDDVEAAGLVKFDFLGLRNLTIIDNAIKIINLSYPESPVDIEKIPLDDAKSFELLKACKTTAVFQLESRGMKDLIRRLQPDSFEEIIALVALFRPGPLQSGMVDDFINRKHGRAEVEYPHPLTESILKPTYGIILYQEQVMMIAQVLAGYSLGQADLLRRAMGKKKPEEMAKQREIFLEGAKTNNIEEETAAYIFDLMEKFAGYGFNKSHSAAYALVAYQTAYLKAHYTAAFMAAVLSSDMDNTDKVVGFIEDCHSLALTVQMPDVNRSLYRFSVVDDQTILFGLGAIKGVGESAIESILAEHEAGGDFRSVFDFCQRVDLRKANKRVLEALIASGAMDQIGPSRAAMLAVLPKAIQMAEQQERASNAGQNDLFGMFDAPSEEQDEIVDYPVVHIDAYQTLLDEKAVLGLFLSDHPIKVYQDDFAALKVMPLAKLKPTGRGETVRIGGIKMAQRRIKTKQGKVMQVVQLDDNTARTEVTLFPEQAEQFGLLLKEEEPFVADVEVANDDFSGGLRARCHHLYTLSSARAEFCRGVTLYLEGDSAVAIEKLRNLQDALSDFPGEAEIKVHVTNAFGSVELALGQTYRFEPSPAFFKTLYRLFGESHVKFRYG